MSETKLAASLNGKLPNSNQNTIRIRGARQHNLKNVDLEIPSRQLIVFTGVSGSGKSSLAFDTIFAEGQRRYVESLSSYARQFLGQMDKPDVEAIEGLSPAISIDQKSTSHNPRSTVGTVTEIYDYLRLLFGRAGEPHCPVCDRSIAPQTIDEMVDKIMELPDRTKFQILAPVVRGKKGTHAKLLSSLASQGFVRVRINGEVRELSDSIELNKKYTHTVEVVIDRLIKKDGIEERLVDSLSTCLKQSNGIAVILYTPTSPNPSLEKEGDKEEDKDQELVFSENFACPEHGAVMEELSPRLFSFNSPYGACSNCHGIGTLKRFSRDLVVPDPQVPIYAAIAPWSEKDNSYYLELLYSLGQDYGFELQTQWQNLTPEQQEIVLHGEEKTPESERTKKFKGVLPILQRQYEGGSELIKHKLEQYIIDQPCPVCEGKKLKPEALAVRLGQYKILDLTGVSITDAQERINNLQLSKRQEQIADLVLREIKARLQFLLDVGLNYLTLNRTAMTLSGGEAQRIRLATQIGSGLTGVLYVLDEPSIGLHQRDNAKLLQTLFRLRDLG
ncbi:MAG: excinuclease ABC subunit A, partial [Rivularia sp. (in: cyanobacteria)]